MQHHRTLLDYLLTFNHFITAEGVAAEGVAAEGVA